ATAARQLAQGFRQPKLADLGSMGEVGNGAQLALRFAKQLLHLLDDRSCRLWAPRMLQLPERKADAGEELHRRVMDCTSNPAPFLRLMLDQRMAEFGAHLTKMDKLCDVVAGGRCVKTPGHLEPIDANLEGVPFPAIVAMIGEAKGHLAGAFHFPDAVGDDGRRGMPFLGLVGAELAIV